MNARKEQAVEQKETKDLREKGGKHGNSVEVVSEDEFEVLFKKFAQQEIPVQVSDVKVQGNSNTSAFVIEAQLEPLKKAATTRELLREAAIAVNRIESLGLFIKCILSLEDGLVQGSVNVIVHIEEGKKPFSANLSSFADTEDQKVAFEGSIQWKNILGFGETWDVTGKYSCSDNHEMCAGFYLPHLKHLPSTLVTRITFLMPEWLKLSSYKVQLAGVSIGLLSDQHHALTYGLSWQSLEEDSYSDVPLLLPSIKYAFTLDNRDSFLRPTRGYAVRYAAQVAGTGLDTAKISARQDLDFRFGFPLGFHNAALNLGLSGGWMLSGKQDHYTKTIFKNDRLSVGKLSSFVSEMNGPSTILGLVSRGIDVINPKEVDTGTSNARELLRGVLAATGFADLSFDLPWGALRRQNIYGHCFLGAGNLAEISEGGRGFCDFLCSWKSFLGIGIVIPTSFLRLEVNFCQVLGHGLMDASKRGVHIGFSSSS